MAKLAFIIALMAISTGLAVGNPVPEFQTPVCTDASTNITGIGSANIHPRDDSNFLDHVRCKALPEGNCHMVLVLSQSGLDMGGIVINNECDQVISVAHSIHWGARTTFARGLLPNDLVIEPRRDQQSIFWYNGQLWQDSMKWSTYRWGESGFFHDQISWKCIV